MLAAAHPEVHVLHRPSKQGWNRPTVPVSGGAWSGADKVFVEMDADLSHDPAALPRIMSATVWADLVLGSRYVPGGGTENWPLHRRALSRGGNRYVQVLSEVPVRDATNGYRACRREVLEELAVESLHPPTATPSNSRRYWSPGDGASSSGRCRSSSWSAERGEQDHPRYHPGGSLEGPAVECGPASPHRPLHARSVVMGRAP